MTDNKKQIPKKYEYKPTPHEDLNDAVSYPRMWINDQIQDDREGYYTIEEGELLYYHDDICECQVSDLTELKVWEYNALVDKIRKNYPLFNITKLEGRFI